jgi:hypothetical protein
MAYDRDQERNAPRDERSRDERLQGRDPGGRDDRGFFERAGDEVASWFGDNESNRRRDEESMRQQREGRSREHGRFFGGGQSGEESRDWGRGQSDDWDWDRDRERSSFGGPPKAERGRFVGGDDERFGGSPGGRDRDERGYRPMTGDYGRSQQSLGNHERFDEPWDRDHFRRTSFAGSRERGPGHDPHYHSWREQHMSELDRDYDEYRRENQARFESEFGSWRERRQQKRGLLGQIREHMQVVGNDDQPVGTIDRVAGDRIILAKSDPESGGGHHSLSCADIDRVEGERVILERPAEEARKRWRDENRGRALFEREDQGEMGPQMLDRSFGGTYR